MRQVDSYTLYVLAALAFLLASHTGPNALTVILPADGSTYSPRLDATVISAR